MEGEGGPWDVFQSKVDALADLLERDRLNLWQTFLYVLIIALARDLSEYYLLDEAFVSTAHPWIFSIAHHVAFFVLTYLGLVLLLKVFSGSGLRKCMNYTNWYYWIILIPPWVDRFLFGLDHNYAYFSWTDFLAAFFQMEGKSFNPGQGTEVVIVLFALFAYVFWRHRDDLMDLQGRLFLAARMGLMAFFVILFMFILGTPGAYLPVGSSGGVPVFPNYDSTRYVQYHLFIFAYYYLACAIIVLVMSFLVLRRRFWSELAALRPYQTVFFAAIVLAGTALSWRAEGGSELVLEILDRPYWVNLAYLLPAIASAVLAWQASVIWNDLSDREWDSPGKRGRVLPAGIVSVSSLKEASIVLAVSSLAASLLLSVQMFAVMAAILVMSLVYSFPPLRFKNALLSPLLMGAGTFLAFIYGALTPYAVIGYAGTIPYLTGETALVHLGPEVLLVGGCMFAGLVVGSMVTDVDGYDEDLAGGVRTIFTVLGMDRGVRVAAMLIFLVALTPLTLFHSISDLIVFPVLGALAAWRFLTSSSSRTVMSLAMIGFLYAMLRFLSLI